MKYSKMCFFSHTLERQREYRARNSYRARVSPALRYSPPPSLLASIIQLPSFAKVAAKRSPVPRNLLLAAQDL